MGTDDIDNAKGAADGEAKASEQPAAEPEEERGSRVDAAKAFFRAMYAGDEPPANSPNFGAPQADKATQTACRNCESLEMGLKEAEAKANENEQLYKRMAADFENYRRRMDREREESVSLGVKKAAEAMLPALDDLDRALTYLTPDTPTDKLLESIKLVSNRIFQCMEQLGLKRLEAVGEVFDPKFHEPVQQIETVEHADGTVMQELRRGYVLGDKVVRPALVNVASNSTGVVQAPAAADAPQQEKALEQTLVSHAADDVPSKADEGLGDEPATVYEIDESAIEQEPTGDQPGEETT